jgi:hypothetical protein
VREACLMLPRTKSVPYMYSFRFCRLSPWCPKRSLETTLQLHTRWANRNEMEIMVAGRGWWKVAAAPLLLLLYAGRSSDVSRALSIVVIWLLFLHRNRCIHAAQRERYHHLSSSRRWGPP